MKKTSCALVILDGWGIGSADSSNPIHIQQPPYINYIKKNFPIGSLQSSGISVGLPWGEEGNSEVGHLTLGSGKVIYQHFPRITMAIRNGDFDKNKILLKTIESAKSRKTALHLIGLLGEGNVHSSLEHLEALIKLAQKEKVARLNLHIFSDGKDSPPHSIHQYLKKLDNIIKTVGIGSIASISGRYYAMDRDERWELTEKAYGALTGQTSLSASPENAIKQTYEQNLDDEFIAPTIINPDGAIKDGDAIIFFNFREDSMRQIVQAFTDADFKQFPTTKFSNLHIATFTKYKTEFKAEAAFPQEEVEFPLGRIIADQELTQLRLAETTKYAHVTYFFNGLKEKPFKNEYRIIIPSSKNPHPDKHPEMMAEEITNRVTQTIEGGGFDFILVNYANPDYIAHTGSYEAALKTVAIIDDQIKILTKTCLAKNITLIITADHGNIERVINPLTSQPETKHDPNPVPIYLINSAWQRPNSESIIKESENRSMGTLADVAPTILDIMGISRHKSMTGQSLLPSLLSQW